MTAENAAAVESRPSDFIRTIINEDVRTGKHGGVVITRFPPEPNGFLHIGHAKSICLNFGLAQEYGGVCHLRFDDTDPAKEDVLFEQAIQEDVRWLGFSWQGKLFHASDYFEQLYQYAVQLIQAGKAYVCSLNEEEIRQYRGSVTEPGQISPYASRTVAENLDLFARMRAGEFKDGEHTVRARIDMAAANMKMRDPLMYRIRHATHHMTGDAWCIYPMYDFAHPLSDAIEGITHSICTLEFENNRELYDWFVANVELGLPHAYVPHQYEFAKLSLNYTIMSKRRLLQLVEGGHVSGWDDPRMPTLAGLRRRGYTPESIRKFCETVGIAKANSVVDMAQLEFCIRDDLNHKARRVMGVLRPLKVTLTNLPDDYQEDLESAYWPEDVPKEEFRTVPFGKHLVIEQDDFLENPPKDFYRLAPGRSVRLRYAYVITCDEAIKDPSGEVIELKCTVDLDTKGGAAPQDGKKVKGVIHWASQTESLRATVRLYDRIVSVAEPATGKGNEFLADLNPNSLQVLEGCYLEPSLKDAQPGERFQFERQGYFIADVVDSKAGVPVFNRIVTLKDSWAKTATPSANAEPAKPHSKPESKSLNRTSVTTKASVERKRDAQQQARLEQYMGQYGLAEDEAMLIAEDEAFAAFYEAALSHVQSPKVLGNWMVNELLKALKTQSLEALAITPQRFAALVSLVENETITAKTGKVVFGLMLSEGGEPAAIVEAKGLAQINDATTLRLLIDQVLTENPEPVAQYRGGNVNVFGMLVGKALKASDGRANPTLLNQLLKATLDV